MKKGMGREGGLGEKESEKLACLVRSDSLYEARKDDVFG